MSKDELSVAELYNYADKTFGEQNWSFDITNQIIDYISEIKNNVEISCTTSIRFYVLDGIFRESIGTSVIISKEKSNAFSRVREMSFCKALQNTLQSFDKFKLTVNREKRLKKQKEMQESWKAKNLQVSQAELREMENDTI